MLLTVNKASRFTVRQGVTLYGKRQLNRGIIKRFMLAHKSIPRILETYLHQEPPYSRILLM